MKTLFKSLLLAIVLVALASTGFGQTALTQTTITAAVNGNGSYSGLSQSVDTAVPLNSVTGVVAPNNGATASFLLIDKELMAVTSVNSTTKVVGVIRGYNGTVAVPHASGAMVLIGGNSQFYAYDPSGACSAANTVNTPWINFLTGRQWLCSTLTLTWVPGFGNPGDSGTPIGVTAAVASAAGLITPSGPLFHITGTSAITGFNIPVGFDATAAGGGSFCAIPDGVFTTTTANNIALASTAVVNKPLCWQWDATNSKFVPSDSILPVANGGTALASGTSGGVLGYTASGTLASSAALASGQFVLGGGAGATPTTSFSVVPVANGGTALASGTSGGVLGYTASGTIASSTALGANQIVIGGGAGATPTSTSAATITPNGTLNLGTAGATVGAVVYANATSGSITVQPPTGALGAVTNQLPDTTGGMPVVINCGAVAAAGACANTNTNGTAHIFYGLFALSANSSLATALSPAYTSTTTYACTGTTSTGTAATIKIANTSASTITITNPGGGATDTISVICVGN